MFVGFCKVEVNPFEPVHNHAVALFELAANVAVPPLHMTPPLVAPVDDGTGFTETTVVYTMFGLQPLPTLLTVSEYVVVTVGVFDGLCKEEVNPFEPIHNQAVALLELACKVAVPPLHIGPLFVSPVEDGVGFTETIVV